VVECVCSQVGVTKRMRSSGLSVNACVRAIRRCALSGVRARACVCMCVCVCVCVCVRACAFRYARNLPRSLCVNVAATENVVGCCIVQSSANEVRVEVHLTRTNKKSSKQTNVSKHKRKIKQIKQ
jgi:hypothetical protein